MRKLYLHSSDLGLPRKQGAVGKEEEVEDDRARESTKHGELEMKKGTMRAK